VKQIMPPHFAFEKDAPPDPGRRAALRLALSAAGAIGFVRTAQSGLAPTSTTQPLVADLNLLLLVDASASVNKGVLDFQLRGHAAAFRSPAVAAAISQGAVGRVMVAVAQFAAPGSLMPLVPWTSLSDARDCDAMARRIDALPGFAMGGPTALGSALIDGVSLLDACPARAPRRTIDLVSNGFNNAGIDLRSARAHARASGTSVNALAILDEYPWLEDYYTREAIVGHDSFARAVDTPEAFPVAFLAKLVREIV
jgi:Ca-activated chloride channel homolog